MSQRLSRLWLESRYSQLLSTDFRASCSLFWTVINEIIIGKGHVLGGLIFLAFILGLIVFALLMLYRESLLKASGKRFSAQPTLSQAEHTARLLPESYIEPIPSVTERTTELLVAEKKSEASQSWSGNAQI